MMDLRADFQEHVEEVEAFLEFVVAIDHAIKGGVPLIQGGTSGKPAVVAPLQQRLLYANVYLHLYNLVEATVSRCMAAIEEVTATSPGLKAGDLSPKLQDEWVRHVAKTHEPLNSENRHAAAIQLLQHLVAQQPVVVKIAKGGGGNWDDEQIHQLAGRLGVTLRLTKGTQSVIKRKIKQDRGALQLIRHYRNQLAHGLMSFSDCGEGLTVTELKELKEWTVRYLEEVISSFEEFIQRYEYLDSGRRPN